MNDAVICNSSKLCVKSNPGELTLRELSKTSTRCCPTGYTETELKKSSIQELMNLLELTTNYLKYRSAKTRNVQFIFLIVRIKAELERRKNERDTESIGSNDSYSTEGSEGYKNRRLAISRSNFIITPRKNIVIPSYLQDNINMSFLGKKTKRSEDFSEPYSVEFDFTNKYCTDYEVDDEDFYRIN